VYNEKDEGRGKNPIVWVLGLIVLLVSIIQFGLYLVDGQERDILKARFQLEFGLTTDIQNLGTLGRKNREFAIWEKMVQTAHFIVEDEAAIAALVGLDENRDPKKIAEAKTIEERVERNKKRLARQLDLAYRFGQFENEAHTTNYRFLGRMIADDLLMNEAKWYDVAKEIEEMRPEP
jgi:hypothetical protein